MIRGDIAVLNVTCTAVSEMLIFVFFMLQPVIVRDYSINSVKRGENLVAAVQFSVKTTSPLHATLISLECNDTKRNFLRVYCADMMMPILGDHLYSVRYAIIQGIATRLKPLHTRPGSASQVSHLHHHSEFN